MTAKEILSPVKTMKEASPACAVDGDMPLFDVLPRLLDSPGRLLGVTDGDISLGVITQDSMLEGLGRMIATRDDCSVITVECRAEDYSASYLAHAVEDSDSHLVDLLTVPAEEGRVRVTLRVRCADPTAAVHSLERYDFHVVEAHGHNGLPPDNGMAIERLMSLQALLNV